MRKNLLRPEEGQKSRAKATSGESLRGESDCHGLLQKGEGLPQNNLEKKFQKKKKEFPFIRDAKTPRKRRES